MRRNFSFVFFLVAYFLSTIRPIPVKAQYDCQKNYQGVCRSTVSGLSFCMPGEHDWGTGLCGEYQGIPLGHCCSPLSVTPKPIQKPGSSDDSSSGGSSSGGAPASINIHGECPSKEYIDTALGCIPIESGEMFPWIIQLAIGISGGIAFLLMLFGGLKILVSAGDPKGIQAGKESITSALLGLLIIVFSVFLLELIGVKILKLPGL